MKTFNIGEYQNGPLRLKYGPFQSQNIRHSINQARLQLIYRFCIMRSIVTQCSKDSRKLLMHIVDPVDKTSANVIVVFSDPRGQVRTKPQYQKGNLPLIHHWHPTAIRRSKDQNVDISVGLVPPCCGLMHYVVMQVSLLYIETRGYDFLALKCCYSSHCNFANQGQIILVWFFVCHIPSKLVVCCYYCIKAQALILSCKTSSCVQRRQKQKQKNIHQQYYTDRILIPFKTFKQGAVNGTFI